MSDFAFVPTEVWKQTRYKAAQAAVLGPLVPHYTSKDLKECFDLVRKQWRKRVMSLVKAEYSALKEPKAGRKIEYLRNCPPVGVRTENFAVPCQRYLVCPWCWGRSVALDAFRHLEDLLYERGTVGKPPEGVSLMAFVTRHVGKRKSATPEGWASEVYNLFAKGGRARQIIAGPARHVERDALYADASYIAHRIEFAKEGQEIWLERCGIALVRRVPKEDKYRARVLADLKEHGSTVLSDAVQFFALGPPTRKVLWQGVRRALSYPRSMLYHDPQIVAAALNGLLSKKARLTARQGPKSRAALFEKIGAKISSTFVDEGVPDDD